MTNTRCSTCSKLFNSVSAFDAHRTGKFAKQGNTRRCLTTKEMREIGLTVDERGRWKREQVSEHPFPLSAA